MGRLLLSRTGPHRHSGRPTRANDGAGSRAGLDPRAGVCIPCHARSGVFCCGITQPGGRASRLSDRPSSLRNPPDVYRPGEITYPGRSLSACRSQGVRASSPDIKKSRSIMSWAREGLIGGPTLSAAQTGTNGALAWSSCHGIGAAPGGHAGRPR
jgi:hypothetical protein